MKGFWAACIFLMAIVVGSSGCSNSEPAEGPFSGCTVYESDGMMVMECPMTALNRQAPDRTPDKHSPLGRVQQPLAACPVSRCYETICWTLCEVEGDVCIYNARPKDRSGVPNSFQKSNPNTSLID